MQSITAANAMTWLQSFRQRILNLLLASMVGLGTFGLVITLIQHIQLGRITLILSYYLGAYLFALFLLFARRLPGNWRAIGFLTLLFIFTAFTFISGWLGGSGRTFLLAFILLSAILLGPRAGIIAVGLSLVCYITFSVLYNQGWLVYPPAPVYAETCVIVIEGIGFAMAVGMLGIGLWFLNEGLLAASRMVRASEDARSLLAERARELDAANQLLARRSELLEAANRELESFSYSVSHDLRAPLRAINGYGCILLTEYADTLDDDGKGCLNNIIVSTQRMSSIIDDLLDLSRVTRVELNRSTVSLSDLAQEVIADLRHDQPERQLEVIIQPGLLVKGDPQLLRIVLENLLGNAWKFTRKQTSARIEFGMQSQQGERVFYVRDNGAGFDMTYAGKIFGTFQRLHREEEFEGTGIGLAIVQRILQRHDGRAWCSAEVNQGATFYFTIGAPAAMPGDISI
jgi:signal transduction histidine kinase